MEDNTTLSPGFRFHPTDEELVRYFLKRKLTGRQFLIDAIAVVEIYKFEPWDLPGQSKLKTRDLEWYFFTALDKKYGSGSRTNRATERGYWKTTGKDRPVKHADRTVGMKKTLVYHLGRAPHGKRSNWVMHEYRMVDEELTRAGVNQDAFVVCRIFEKSGPGPKNGEKYGAPLLEDLDDKEEEAPVPVLVAGRVGAFAGADDLNPEKKLDMAIASAGLPSKFYHGECSSYPGHHQESIDDQKPLVDTDGVFEPQIGQGFNMTEEVYSLKDGDDGECSSYPEHHRVSIEDLEPLVGTDGVLEPQIDQAFNTTEPYAEAIYSWNDGDKLGHNGDPAGFFDAIGDMELYFDANDLPPVADGSYLETNDLLNPVTDPYGTDMLEAFLASYSDEDDVSKYICFDSPQSVEGENSVPAPPFIQQNVEGVTNDVGAHSSNKAANEAAAAASQLGSESTNPLVKRANTFLANIPAPPAFASEYPSKDMALRFHSSPQSSNAAHVTAGMVSITPRGNPTGWILGKNGMLNTIISAGCSHPDVASVVMIPVLYPKTAFVLSHGWIFLILFSVLLLSLSYKIACCMYTSK